MSAPDFTGVRVYDSLVEFNKKRYEEAKNKGVIPGTFPSSLGFSLTCSII